MSFGLTLKTLPDSYKKLLAPEDRKALGKDGLLSEEVIARGRVKLERDLRKHVLNLLRLRGIEPISARDDKKSTITVGLPDILFAVKGQFMFSSGGGDWMTRYADVACAWELKLPGEKLDPEQIKMAAKLSEKPNAWRWALITSVDEAIKELANIGLAAKA